MITEKQLQELFLSTLQHIYHGEKLILTTLPKMAKQTSSPELRQAFEHHEKQTQGQVERLQRIFEMMGKNASGKICEAIAGLVKEGNQVMSEAQKGEVMDARLIASAQAIEHYEIARYGTLRTWANQLDLQEAAKLLEQTLEEEKEADKLLNKIAMQQLNRRAA
jgi:ferritin-like metal-binding protein YciE